MTEVEMIAIGIAAVPDPWKERAYRYISKLLSSSFTRQKYPDLLKTLQEQRFLSVDEKRILNIHKACQRASNILGEENLNDSSNDDSPYEDDWISTWENEACQKSSEDMQERFARMLAGEIKRPGTFSIRSVRLLGQIDQETASAFKILCSGCISYDHPFGSKVIECSIFPSFDAPGPRGGRFIPTRYGISNRMLSNLTGFSLIEPALRAYIGQRAELKIQESFWDDTTKTCLPFMYQGKYFVLRKRNIQDRAFSDIGISGLFLSSLGRELMSIVEMSKIKQLTIDMQKHFRGFNLELVEVELISDNRFEMKS